MSIQKIILLSPFCCFFRVCSHGGDFKTGTVEIEPLNSIKRRSVSQKRLEMPLIALLRPVETCDDESVAGAVKLDGMCAENHTPRGDVSAVQAVILTSKVMEEGFIVEAAVEMRAPVTDDFFQVRNQAFTILTERMPSGASRERPDNRTRLSSCDGACRRSPSPTQRHTVRRSCFAFSSERRAS